MKPFLIINNIFFVTLLQLLSSCGGGKGQSSNNPAVTTNQHQAAGAFSAEQLNAKFSQSSLHNSKKVGQSFSISLEGVSEQVIRNQQFTTTLLRSEQF